MLLLVPASVLAQTPINDQCSNAIQLSSGSYVSSSTNQAGVDTLPCGSFPGVWYSFVGNDSVVTVELVQTPGWLGCFALVEDACTTPICASPMMEIPDVGQNDTLTFPFIADAGETYFIYIFSFCKVRAEISSCGSTQTTTRLLSMQQLQAGSLTNSQRLAPGYAHVYSVVSKPGHFAHFIR